MDTNLSRRRLMQSVAGGVFLSTLPDWAVRSAEARALEADAQTPKKFAPNDKIRMGLIGPGGSKGGFRQGTSDMYGIRNQPGVEVVAVCDVDLAHLEEAAQTFKDSNDKPAAKYADFRYLLDRPDIDAVVIGTPDHWHAIIAAHAMKAGKDIYCEKPMTLVLDEGKELVKIARKNNTVFQVGSQQRSDGRFRLACELVRNGRIGKVKKVVAHLPGGPTGGPFEVQSVPTDFLYDMWLGPAPEAPYVKERTHGNFRHWYEYSGGMMTDWGAHHLDIAQWGLGRDGDGPVKVRASAPLPKADPTRCSYACAPQFEVTYTYADGVELVATSQGENGVHFYGEDGRWIFVSRSTIGASDQKIIDELLPKSAILLYNSRNHQKDFIDCMRARKRPICDVEIGHRSVSVCHLGNICIRLGGGELLWNPKKEEFVGGEKKDAANALRSYKYRGGWTL
jgi:predicted dehydrogenase